MNNSRELDLSNLEYDQFLLALLQSEKASVLIWSFFFFIPRA